MKDSIDGGLERAVSKKTAAENLSVSVKTIERLIARGELRAFRVLGQVRIMISDLQNFIKRQLDSHKKS
jgi:excisionase family DNA binding protein